MMLFMFYIPTKKIDRYCSDSYETNEEIKALRGKVICPSLMRVRGLKGP